jgi:hypothetical protein
MSRTYKDRPWKVANPESRWDFGTERIAYESTRRVYELDLTTNNYCFVDTDEICIKYFHADIAGVKTKKKKRVDTEWHWMTTPGWYISEFMNRPQRARGRMWEKRISKVNIEDLDTLDLPDISRKPHVYYW